MLKNILSLNGVHELNKNEQKFILGGGGETACESNADCATGEICCADLPGQAANCQACPCSQTCDGEPPIG
jgi:hypothetical protein